MPETIDDLRELVRPGQGRTRPLFTVKLYEAVRFVAAHPESIATVGAVWCPDGCGVLIQHQTLAQMFGVKTETIPRNLNDHGFRKVRMSPNELEELAHVVGNPESWRKEVQKDGLFTKRASIERVMEIPKSPPTAPTYHGRLLDFIPYELTGVITESQCIDLLTLKHDLRYDDDRANVVIRKAWSFWSRAQGGHGGSMQEIPLREILVTLIPGSSSPRVENENQVLRINVAHLIWRWDRGTGSEGQVADERISFVVFLRFIVRYWSFEDPQDIVIRDIAARGPNAGNPQWKDWFLPPPADVWAAKVRMADRREKRIYVVESKDPKAFQVLTWHDSRETPLVGNVIHHPDRNERFEVVFPGGQATSGATLSEVLSRSLEFCVPWRWHLQVDPTAVAQTAAVDPAEGRVEVPVAFDDPGDEEGWYWFQ